MKNKKSILIALITVSMFLFVMPVIADEEQHAHAGQTTDQCATPSKELTITALEGDSAIEDKALSFDKGEYVVPKGACVEITFINQNVQLHDFSVEEDHDNEFDGFHVAINGSLLRDEHDPDNNSVHIQFPDVDVTYEMECTVLGHKESGMVSRIVVGKGSATAPGFEFLIVLTGVFIATFIFRNKKN